jgi:hypothetical protein
MFLRSAVLPDKEKVAQRVIEKFGGKEKLNAHVEKSIADINEKWVQDVDSIGRILRAHLFVEHYLDLFLQNIQPQLNFEKAGLSFYRKVTLIEDYSPDVKKIAPGLLRLNTIRNRMAHTLLAETTDGDMKYILSDVTFAALRVALAAPEEPPEAHIDIIEDFAKQVGSYFESTINNESLANAFKEAYEELMNET